MVSPYESLYRLAERFVAWSVRRERSPAGKPDFMDPNEWGAWLAASSTEQRGTSTTTSGNFDLYHGIRDVQRNLLDGRTALDPHFQDTLGHRN